MAKIAFVSPFPLFPAVAGNRVRTLNMLRAAEGLGHEAHFILMPSRRMGDFDEAAHRAVFGRSRFHLLKRAPAGEILYLLRRSTYAARRKLNGSQFRLSSVDETYFSSFTDQLRRLDATIGFATAIVQYVAFSRALDGFGAQVRRLIDTHDSFAGQMPAAEEARGLMRADEVIAIQDAEAAVFRQLLEPRRVPVTLIGHFIEMQACLPTERCEGATFIGSNFPQNNVSLKWFITQVLPLIRREEPLFRLTVAGSVDAAVPGADGVDRIGRVAAFRDAFRDTPILVNAITSGSGQKIKLLEAFGCGIPAVSTALGVAGMGHDDLAGVCVVPDGDAAAFATATLDLYRSAARRRELGLVNHAIGGNWNQRQIASLASCLMPEQKRSSPPVRQA